MSEAKKLSHKTKQIFNTVLVLYKIITYIRTKNETMHLFLAICCYRTGQWV